MEGLPTSCIVLLLGVLVDGAVRLLKFPISWILTYVFKKQKEIQEYCLRIA